VHCRDVTSLALSSLPRRSEATTLSGRPVVIALSIPATKMLLELIRREVSISNFAQVALSAKASQHQPGSWQILNPRISFWREIQFISLFMIS
jgi:post-segregation antitoxin (ccd killing protein)